jgi:hypothetical protein
MLKVFCPFIWVASTFQNFFWGETLQLLTVFKVIYFLILVAITFKNSFLQLVTAFKVVYPVIWVASTFKNSFWGRNLPAAPSVKSLSPIHLG